MLDQLLDDPIIFNILYFCLFSYLSYVITGNLLKNILLFYMQKAALPPQKVYRFVQNHSLLRIYATNDMKRAILSNKDYIVPPALKVIGLSLLIGVCYISISIVIMMLALADHEVSAIITQIACVVLVISLLGVIYAGTRPLRLVVQRKKKKDRI